MPFPINTLTSRHKVTWPLDRFSIITTGFLYDSGTTLLYQPNGLRAFAFHDSYLTTRLYGVMQSAAAYLDYVLTRKYCFALLNALALLGKSPLLFTSFIVNL